MKEGVWRAQVLLRPTLRREGWRLTRWEERLKREREKLGKEGRTLKLKEKQFKWARFGFFAAAGGTFASIVAILVTIDLDQQTKLETRRMEVASAGIRVAEQCLSSLTVPLVSDQDVLLLRVIQFLTIDELVLTDIPFSTSFPSKNLCASPVWGKLGERLDTCFGIAPVAKLESLDVCFSLRPSGMDDHWEKFAMGGGAPLQWAYIEQHFRRLLTLFALLEQRARLVERMVADSRQLYGQSESSMVDENGKVRLDFFPVNVATVADLVVGADPYRENFPESLVVVRRSAQEYLSGVLGREKIFALAFLRRFDADYTPGAPTLSDQRSLMEWFSHRIKQ